MWVALATFQLWPQAHRRFAPLQRRASYSRHAGRHHHAPADLARDLLQGPAAPALPAHGQLIPDARQGRPMRGQQQHLPERAPVESETLVLT